ncbi:hypothetical protein VPH35_051709 [Triticum aestivum]
MSFEKSRSIFLVNEDFYQYYTFPFLETINLAQRMIFFFRIHGYFFLLLCITIDSCACAKGKKMSYWMRMRMPTNQFSLSDVGAGVIEVDYRGLVGVVLFNHLEADFIVKPDDRATQMIIQVIATPEVAEVEDLYATVRREGLLGSTDVSTPKLGRCI